MDDDEKHVDMASDYVPCMETDEASGDLTGNIL